MYEKNCSYLVREGRLFKKKLVVCAKNHCVVPCKTSYAADFNTSSETNLLPLIVGQAVKYVFRSKRRAPVTSTFSSKKSEWNFLLGLVCFLLNYVILTALNWSTENYFSGNISNFENERDFNKAFLFLHPHPSE